MRPDALSWLPQTATPPTLTIESLAAIDRPHGEASGLPNQAYTDPGYACLERDHVFAKTWSCVGVGADLPRPGDARPASLLGIPLLLVRDREGAIRVFHNVCSHRGAELVTRPCNVGRTLRCPYHSWTYDFDGRLRATPMVGGPGHNSCEGFDKARHGLRAVRTAVWFDLVFVNLSGDAPPFEDHVRPLAERWSHCDPSRLVHGGADSRWEIALDANWKLAVENHDDAYHLPWVHPGLNSYSRFDDHYEIVIGELFAGQGSRAYRPRRPAGAPALPMAAGVPEAWRERAEYVALYPNVIFGWHADHVSTVWLEPLRCDRTVERMNLYYPGDTAESGAHAAARRAVCEEWRAIWAEDQGIVESMQRGRASPAFAGGVFTPVLDRPIHHLHRWVARRLADGLTHAA
jgi:choline monooxygenase